MSSSNIKCRYGRSVDREIVDILGLSIDQVLMHDLRHVDLPRAGGRRHLQGRQISFLKDMPWMNWVL